MAARPAGRWKRSSFSARSWTCRTTLRLMLWTKLTATGLAFFSFHGAPSNNYHPRRNLLVPSASSTSSTTAVATASSFPSTQKPSRSASQLFGCSIELVEPETQCPVVLVGCIHGTRSSVADVEAVLLQEIETTTKNPQVLVLELCASRFTLLLKDHQDAQQRPGAYQKDEDATNVQPQPPRRGQPQKQSWIQRCQRAIQMTVQLWGLSTAVALLDGISGLQASLSNLEPGLEFLTAAQIASRHNMYIYLADQDAETTLYKMGQLPRTALELWRDCLQYGWHDTFGREWQALYTALFGCNKESSITVGAFLTRSDAAVRDMLRLTVATFLLVKLGSVALTLGVGLVLQLVVMMTSPPVVAPADSAISTTASEWWTTTATAVATSAASNGVDTIAVPDAADWTGMAIVGAHFVYRVVVWMTVVLPLTRVVVRERDDQLAEGIRYACRHCISNGDGSGSVVAVLGALHVNGVAQRLRQTTMGADYPSGMDENENRSS